ncbi:MAG TPA: CBS domain-containing protein [Terriglobales bacterium]|jgi:CBS domain-containing protein|nr:CBS domain-containing protein [Terriglobales bacterium]
MASVDSLIRDRETYQVEADELVVDVVSLMVSKNVGAVAVIRQGELAGLFSERDLMKRVVHEGRDPRVTKIFEVMTRDVVTVAPDRSLEDCLELMRERGFRHLPVCQGKQLRGVISLRDLLAHAVVEKDGEVQMMRAYISQST